MRRNRRVGEDRLNLVGLNALPSRYYTPTRMRRIAQAQAMEWVYRNSGINPVSLAENNGWADGRFPRVGMADSNYGLLID